MTYANPHFLVETEWLEAHLGDAGLRVIGKSSLDPVADKLGLVNGQ